MAEGENRLIAGRYRLRGSLGRGGMGVVWRAHDEFLHRDVAVKEVHHRIGLSDVEAKLSLRRTLREARAAARLKHPGIVAVHDVVIDEGRPLIVMELVEGRSLAQVIHDVGPLPELRVAEIGRQVLGALGLAHRRGILHRDVKPANILLSGDRVVLTDFGIAAMEGATALTDQDALIGSPEYLAPERVNGHPASPASDLWSLGVTLCAAVRGESPFERADTQATLAAVLTFEPTPVAAAGRLWPIIAGLLHKDPVERLTTTGATERLAELLTPGEPPIRQVAVPVVVNRSTPGRRPRSRTIRRFSIPLVAVLLVAAAFWVVWRPDDPPAAAMPTSPSSSGAAAQRGDSLPPTTSAPAGFTGYRDVAGFSIAVPAGWRKESIEQEVYWASSDDKRRTLWAHVEWQDNAAQTDALTFLREFEVDEFSSDFVTNYQRIRLEETGTMHGMSVAELECTYRENVSGGFHTHELLRAILTDSGRRYTLTLASQTGEALSAEALWQSSLVELTAILRSFRVTP